MNVVMLVKNSFEYDARVTKEAVTLIDEGHDVHVVAYHVPGVTPQEETTDDGIHVVRVTRVNLGVDQLNALAQRFSVFIERRRARMLGDTPDEGAALAAGTLDRDTTATPGAAPAAGSAAAPTGETSETAPGPDPGATGAGPGTAEAGSAATASSSAVAATRPGPVGGDGRAWWVDASTAVLRAGVRAIKLGFRLAKALLGRQGQGLKHYAINRRFIDEAVALRPDVVHAHDLNTLWAARQVKQRTGCRLVYDSHEMATARNRMTTGWRLWCEHFERQGVPDADEIVMASPGYAEVCRQRYGRDATVIINVPRPQEPTGDRDLRQATGVPARDTLLVYQGSIQENRGIEQVIDAVEIVNGRRAADAPRVSFVVVGYGYHRPALEQQVADRGLSDVVRFFGPVPNPELVDWSSSADIGMCTIVGTSPSYRESLPNKLFEYVMAGLPVVTSDFGSMGRITDEQGVGVTCDPTDPRALARAIEHLRDPEVHAAAAAATPAMAARYNWEVEQQSLVELYERLAT